MLGTGIGQIAFILIIMLIVAGPKRMMQWAYVLGQYLSKFRAIYAETITTINKELQSTGIELPKDPTMLKPRLFDVVSEAGKVLSGTTQAPASPTPAPAIQPTAAATPEQTSTPSTDNASSTPSLTLSSESEHPNGDQKKYDAWTPKE